jgi:hypothetical protein
VRTKAVILAGGEGTRLASLTTKRAKPAVPFGGKYRIIDFTLSNCVNSNIFDLLILTQYRPHSLMDHIAGRPWDLDRTLRGANSPALQGQFRYGLVCRCGGRRNRISALSGSVGSSDLWAIIYGWTAYVRFTGRKADATVCAIRDR